MKRIGIITDTHGDRGHMESALMKMEIAAGGPLDTLIHCGDHARDASWIGRNILQVLPVRGNCDPWDDDIPEDRLIQIDGIRFFITHGHRYEVKRGTSFLSSCAASKGAQICCFGHTHALYHACEDGVLMINPGACLYTGSCALVLSSGNGKYEAKLLSYRS